ncbi:MAG: hypothetical protein KA745_12365 [Gemmatimonadales bacterium]|nr:hypothetical protein [Gemmatimonadales bacterium]
MAAGRWKFASSLLLAALAAGLMLHFRPRPPRPFDGAPPGVPAAALREGDLVFRRGHGLWSGLFAEASAHDRRFSHVGVLLRTGGIWQVAHASADELTGLGGTAAEPLEMFLRDATDFEIRRPRLGPAELAGFVEALHRAVRTYTPFDTSFSLATPERVYCTELIWQAWVRATGADPLPRKTLWRGQPIVSIDDVLSLGEVVRLRP